MRLPQALATALVLVSSLSAVHAVRADPPRAAVFPFELDDTSLQGAMNGQETEDLARLARLDTQLRDALARSGRYAPVVVPAESGGRTLWSCNGCEAEQARKADARFAVVGWVQKVSNLILNINLVIRDVATGERVAGGSVDIRGDTDESWTRGLSYLLRNRILTGER
nr:DUF3280 domain-containing protein [uncultured Rhodopila sp.]